MAAAEIYTRHDLRDRQHVFAGRAEAGKVLAEMLAPRYRRAKKAVVAAIPSGGIPVGLEIARALELPFELVIVRKLLIPGNTEAGFGAMTMSGEVILNDSLVDRLHLSRRDIRQEETKVRGDLARRNALYRRGRPPFPAEGRTVILADDGLASGYTMLASVGDVRGRGAVGIVVAVPTAPARNLSGLVDFVEEIVCPNIRDEPYFAVANAYQSWRDLDADEVISMLRRAGRGEVRTELAEDLDSSP